MSNRANHWRLAALPAAIMMAGSSYAQQDDAAQEPVQIEEVVVVGIRAATQKSIDDKRTAQGIVDTINAEDIGKTTDQNIAEALSRVTGVSLNSRDGEGTTITVRGAGASQNNISLNGVVLTSTDFNQAVDLSSFSADVLSKLEVVKTPSADHEEGSLGANVNLTTAKPLDTDPVRSLTLQGRYSDFSEEGNYKVSGTISEKLFDDRFGVIFTGFSETSSIRSDRFRVDDYASTPSDPAVRVARDTDGNLIGSSDGEPLRALEPTELNYELLQNESNRYGANLGMQFEVSDTTELAFDVNYSFQEQVRNRNALQIRRPNSTAPNHVAGVGNQVIGRAPTFTDPQQDWYVINTETRTFEKKLDRFGSGAFVVAEGGDDIENTVASLSLNHEFTPALRGEFKLGYSQSESESIPNAFLVMQSFAEITTQVLFDAPPVDAPNGIQPVGFDCTSGPCRIVFGDGVLDFGENNETYTEQVPSEENPDELVTVTRARGFDNSGRTGFNPDDVAPQHIAFLSEADRKVEDTRGNFQADFDLDVDSGGVTSVEFGFKITAREKDVDNQSFEFNSVSASDIGVGEDGRPVAVSNSTLQDVNSPALQTGESFPYDDFLDSLGYSRDAATNGFDDLSARRAVDFLVADDETVRVRNNVESRVINIDTQALYLKTNFSFINERLTGDVGFRYVRTDIESEGFSGMNFFAQGETLGREFDFLKLFELADTNLVACPGIVDRENVDNEAELRYQRIDGNGFDTVSADPSQWVAIPAFGQACHEPEFAERRRIQRGIASGDLPSDTEVPGVNWLDLWRHADISTTNTFIWDRNTDNISFNPKAAGINAYTHSVVENRSVRTIGAVNDHSYSNFLPSLNINFAFTDDLVGRFAISRTMSRPEIDQTRAGFSGVETGFDPRSSRLTRFNTKLEPLKSDNLDLSLEWYFGDSSLVSGTFFYKKLSDFTQADSRRGYITDLRDLQEQDAVSGDNLVLAFEDDVSGANADPGVIKNGAATYGLEGCLPKRGVADLPLAARQETLALDYREACGLYTITTIQNSQDARVKGLELQYIQNFEHDNYFLGGLGLNVNYTYQESEFEPDSDGNIFPIAQTPEHSYNASLFWQQDLHQVRLSVRGASDSLVDTDINTARPGRTFNQGSLWNDGNNVLDLSATYGINENISVIFQAINLADAETRTYYTSRRNDLSDGVDADGNVILFNEGSPLRDGATKSRTIARSKVGTTFRLGIQAKF